MIISLDSYTAISIFAFYAQLNFIGVVRFPDGEEYDFSVTPDTTMIKTDKIILYGIVLFSFLFTPTKV